MRKIDFFFVVLMNPLITQAEGVILQPPVIDVVIKSVACNSGPYQPQLPTTLNSIKALGKIKKEVIQPTMDYEKDTLSRAGLDFDGMTLSLILDNKNTSVSFIEGATFSNSHWNKISPIAIGSPITDFLKKEGVSETLPSNSIVSACSSNEGAPDCINLTLKNHKIVKIEYQCYTG